MIVAVSEEEVVRLKALYMRALANNCKDIRLINGDELRTIEPHCQVSLGCGCVTMVICHLQGRMAIHSPHTGIVDWARVTRAYAEDFKQAGGVVHTGFEVGSYAHTHTHTHTLTRTHMHTR